MRGHLVVLAKPPLAGRAKTRLAADVGPARAAAFYRRSTRRLLWRLSDDPRWRTWLSVNARAGDDHDCWPRRVPRLVQGGGTLGDRMKRPLGALPPGPVVMLGTDAPQVEPRDVAAAFDALRASDAVFGPADDGGYWLIGLARRRPAPRLFGGVRWSTAHALADTRASLPDGFAVATLQVLTDVDDAAGLAALGRDWGPMRFGPWRRCPRG